MADSTATFFNLDTWTGSSPFTVYSPIVKTEDARDFSFRLHINTLSGAGGDTLDITIEESDEEDFANAFRARTLLSFTQVLGDSTSASLLKQAIDNPLDNVNRYIRAKVAITGTVATFSQKVVCEYLLNERV